MELTGGVLLYDDNGRLVRVNNADNTRILYHYEMGDPESRRLLLLEFLS